MLYGLPAEVTLNVLSYLPIPSLLSLPVLSRRWLDFFTANQSTIFRSAALLHEYMQPRTSLLEDALSLNTGRPWTGSTSWKDFCRRSIQLRKNWEGKGHAVARAFSPPGLNVYRLKVDEKRGICIMTCIWGGLNVVHLFSGTLLWCLSMSHVPSRARCEYDNGYLVFDQNQEEDTSREVWRLTSEFTAEGEVAADAPPDGRQMDVSARAELYHQYAPLGQFQPWALLRFPEIAWKYRLVYPTLLCASDEHAFLHDVRTGSLLQTIDLRYRDISDGDVNERHVFFCELDAVHVFSRESGNEVLCIPTDVSLWSSQRVEDPFLVSGDWFTTPLSLYSEVVYEHRPTWFVAARVSRDGRDLVVLSKNTCSIVFIRDFERICRGETSLEQAGLVLNIQPKDTCYYLDFEHDHACVATMQGLYIFTFDPGCSARVAFVRPSENASDGSPSYPISCVQLTERRIYFTWEDERHRQDIPLFEDVENARELSRPITPAFDPDFQMSPWIVEHEEVQLRARQCHLSPPVTTTLPAAHLPNPPTQDELLITYRL
ncbi:hypothetical protein EDB92DRAFT_1950395 [Lactarius akahatsu]|uniref:F-box domain-containing protein n=1 Tax=Lactarius akahatsu TaxID=416441 RepID=A0AAD4Q539_9AGAM|nr:hypothetical protein EDB92DRAFT_1950395 [Lactarius akahatsu]